MPLPPEGHRAFSLPSQTDLRLDCGGRGLRGCGGGCPLGEESGLAWLLVVWVGDRGDIAAPRPHNY